MCLRAAGSRGGMNPKQTTATEIRARNQADGRRRARASRSDGPTRLLRRVVVGVGRGDSYAGRNLCIPARRLLRPRILAKPARRRSSGPARVRGSPVVRLPLAAGERWSGPGKGGTRRRAGKAGDQGRHRLPDRRGQQAVHRDRGAVAGSGRRARPRRPAVASPSDGFPDRREFVSCSSSPVWVSRTWVAIPRFPKLGQHLRRLAEVRPGTVIL